MEKIEIIVDGQIYYFHKEEYLKMHKFWEDLKMSNLKSLMGIKTY